MNVIEVAEKFCAAWSSLDAEAFSSLFAPDGYHTDIAFGVTRRGRENVWHGRSRLVADLSGRGQRRQEAD